MILYSIGYSPWSERARLALKHCDVKFEGRAYQSMLGEPMMRWRTGRWRGRISVPILFVDEHAIFDSTEIARWASRRCPERTLFPEGRDAEIAEWVDLSERMLAAGRRRTTKLVMGDPVAARASVAASAPGGGLLPGFAIRATGKWLLRKYSDLEVAESDEDVLRRSLERLREGLSGRPTLLDELSWADLSMAVGLHFVKPPEKIRRFVPPQAWEHWHAPELADEFADLVDWRDGIVR